MTGSTSAATPSAASALGGFRVVDFTHFIAGPFCSMILGDLGADVIKIENADAGGDSMRAFEPRLEGESAAFLWTNRNKRSITLNLANADARRIAVELIAKADVLVENFSAKVMSQFGLDYESMSKINPRLVYCSISAYGREGSLADRTGLDPVVQAESGFMGLNGDEETGPLRTGPSVMDMSTGMMASNAILAALVSRASTGRGQRVGVALFDVAVTMLGFHAMNFLASRKVPRRFGNNSLDTAPTGVFQASDGPIYLVASNDKLFRRLVTMAFDRPDLADLSEYATNSSRIANRKQLFAEINVILGRASRAHWLTKLRAASVPAGEVRELDEAMSSDEVRQRKLVSEIAHPKAGTVPNIASPLTLWGTPIVAPKAAPMLGEHTRQVLAELGRSEEQMAALDKSGVLGKAAPAR